MGEHTTIAWAHHTFNPWWGCTKISQGCAHCYAEIVAKRSGQDLWGSAAGRRLFADGHWKSPERYNTRAAKQGIRERVFCGSMCDVFDDAIGLDGQRARLFDLIERTSWLDWLLLTKRPENIGGMLPGDWFVEGLPRNSWMGVSAEGQAQLDERWSILDSETHYLRPAVLFLSAEPLLEPIDLENVLSEIDAGDDDSPWWTRAPDWVIVGGESQAGCRPMELDWCYSLVAQCQEPGVPVFVKQLGGHPDKRDCMLEWPDSLRVQQFPICDG